MEKNKIYFFSIAVFLVAVTVIIFRYEAKEKNKEAKVYYLLDRNGVGVESGEWQEVRELFASLLKKLDHNPDDIKSRIALAGLYIREARVSGNHLYYDQAAMKCVNHVLKLNENNFEALSLKAMIFLSEHHFAEALATAQKAVVINPHNAFVYGSLVDGYVEMGDYKAAIENLEKMMSIRPDLRSYSRVSYLREIHGDFTGAIEAMKLAVDAGAPGDESSAWARVQLGQLYEKTGDMKTAKMHYHIALNDRPGYAYAISGLARTAVVEKKYDEAIMLYQKADSFIKDYSLKDQLSEVYLLKGETKKAAAISRSIVEDMINMSNKEKEQDSIGHYSDRELAYAYLKVNNPDKALEFALAEYNRRPENIDVNETVAWVYYCRGEYGKAKKHLKVALKTNSKNPILLCRAGLIYSKSGDALTGRALLEEVLATNANIPGDLKAAGEKTLQNL